MNKCVKCGAKHEDLTYVRGFGWICEDCEIEVTLRLYAIDVTKFPKKEIVNYEKLNNRPN